MMLSSSVKRNKFGYAPRKVIPAVSVDGLDLPESDPEPERDHVAGDDGGPEERRDSEDQNLGPVSVRRGETHRSGVLVVDLVDILVAPLVVKKSVDPIVRVVFDHEVDEQLGQNFPSRRQWQPRSNPYHLDGRERDELKRTDDEEEHPKHRLVAREHIGERKPDLRLNLEPLDSGGAEELGGGDGNRSDREEDEEEEDVVAVENVVGLRSRVVEPESLRRRQVPAERRRGLRHRRVRHHCFWRRSREYVCK